jgi:hypothetical protein
MSGAVLEVNDFKDVVNLTRKHLIPLLEHLDRTGVTSRVGELRTILPVSPRTEGAAAAPVATAAEPLPDAGGAAGPQS